MKLQIRQNVFETNSSSTHSISISADTDSLLDTLIPDKNGDVLLNGGEFGWQEKIYNDVQSKASYLAIYATDWAYDKKESFTQILKDVIKEQTGCKNVIFNFTDYDSFIDHQSVETNNYHYLFDNKELLRQFIFNKQSYLKTENDN